MKFWGRSKRRLVVLLLLFVLIPVGCTAAYGAQIRCQLVGWSGMTRLPGNIFVAPETTDVEKNTFVSLHSEAVLRNKAFLGETFSSPIVIVASTPELMSRFGQTGNRTAVTHLAFGTAAIVIGPDGANVDVVAHELLHAEIAHRIGWWNRELRLPVWFDEGLAMQVDYREAYSEEAWQTRTEFGANAPEVTKLTSQRSFFTEKSWLHFATAKHEVARWLDVVGHDGLLDLLRSLEAGKPFSDAYHAIEAERKEKSDRQAPKP